MSVTTMATQKSASVQGHCLKDEPPFLGGMAAGIRSLPYTVLLLWLKNRTRFSSKLPQPVYNSPRLLP
jgi:hypothetical protein